MAMDQEKKDGRSHKTKTAVRLLLIITIIIIILMLLRACGTLSRVPQEDAPIGDFEITDTQRPGTAGQEAEEEAPRIAFALQLSYEVSAESPEIEFRNPEENFVDFVFTLTDVASGEQVARTGRVPAGKYVYVNVADFYAEPGVYDVALHISTFDMESGEQKNGLNQTVELVVKE